MTKTERVSACGKSEGREGNKDLQQKYVMFPIIQHFFKTFLLERTSFYAFRVRPIQTEARISISTQRAGM